MSSLKSQKPTVTYRPEIQLLLCCCRTDIEPEIAGRIKTLAQQELDWEYIRSLAGYHGLVPLLYQSLQQTCPQAVPAPILSQLQAEFQANALKNLFLTKELLKILTLCQQYEIPVLPYKGPALAALLYGNVALRTFCDLDLLVDKADFFPVISLLKKHGYQSTYPLSPEEEQAYYQLYSEYSLTKQGGTVVLDLHHAIAPNYFQFSLELPDFWQHRTWVSLAGKKVPQIPVEDLLLLLCLHGCKDSWRQLKWIGDIAQLLHRFPQLDWERVLERAKLLPSQRMLSIGLLLARDLLGISLPAAVVQAIEADRTSQEIATGIKLRLFEGTAFTLLKQRLVQFAFYFRLKNHLGEKVRFCFGYLMYLIFPKPADFGWLPLPSRFYLLYFLLRPLRMLHKYRPLTEGGNREQETGNRTLV